jgi:transcriptional regulator with XRE-family HTH domain
MPRPKKAAAAQPPRRSAQRPSEELPALGPRVRTLRRLHRLRLKDLADKAGCSESLLSRIENGLVVPSLTTLHRLCRALEVNIAALIEAQEEKICIVYGPENRPRYTQRGAGEGDGSTAEILIPFANDRLLEGLLLELPAQGPICGPFRHAGEEVGFVIAGELELHVEDEHYSVPTGHSFFFSSERPHSYRAAGGENCRIIWINTPPTF